MNYNNFNQNYGAQLRPEDVRGYNTRRDAGGQIFESPEAMQPLLNQSQMQAAALRNRVPAPQPMQQNRRPGRGILGLAQAGYNKFKNRGN